MIKEAIAQLVKREDLTSEVMEQVMEEIMTGEATDAQKASFLTALSMKGETIDEITSAAKVLRSHCERFLNDMDVLEIVGTGGDGSNTINISTLSSVVVSAAGIPVAKHGNRAASSKCGTADCLEALGVKIDCAPARSAQILKDINLCFLFAQKYHHQKSVRLGLVAHTHPVHQDFRVSVLVGRFQIFGPVRFLRVNGEIQFNLLFLVFQVIVFVCNDGHNEPFIQKGGQLCAVRLRILLC